MAKAKKKPARRPARGKAKPPAPPAPARKRTAPDWGPLFLTVLARTANIKAACLAAGKARSTVYERRDSEPAFASAMADALEDATEDLELEARRRAHEGLRRVKFHAGEPIMVPTYGPDGQPLMSEDGEPVLVPYVEHEYSDTLMMFLLKAHRPERYRERVEVKNTGTVAHQHSFDLTKLTDAQLDQLERLATAAAR